MQHFVARNCYCTLFMIDFPLNKLKFDCKKKKQTKNENTLKLKNCVPKLKKVLELKSTPIRLNKYRIWKTKIFVRRLQIK